MLNKNYWVDYIIDMKKDLCWESCMIRFDSILFASKGWWQLTTNLVLLFFGFLKFSGFTFESIQYYFPITLLRFSFNLVVLNTIRKWNHNSCRASGDSIDFFFSFFFFFFLLIHSVMIHRRYDTDLLACDTVFSTACEFLFHVNYIHIHQLIVIPD